MSQPDDHNSLQITVLTEANEILRDELLKVLAQMDRQGRACAAIATALWEESDLPETSAVRAAIYRDVAKRIDEMLAGDHV